MDQKVHRHRALGPRPDIEALLAEYREKSALDLDKAGLRELEALHARIDAHDGWHIDQRVETTITDLRPAGRQAR